MFWGQQKSLFAANGFLTNLLFCNDLMLGCFPIKDYILKFRFVFLKISTCFLIVFKWDQRSNKKSENKTGPPPSKMRQLLATLVKQKKTGGFSSGKVKQFSVNEVCPTNDLLLKIWKKLHRITQLERFKINIIGWTDRMTYIHLTHMGQMDGHSAKSYFQTWKPD